MHMRCEKDQWTLVASGVQKGFIWSGYLFPTPILGTYVDTGATAPTEQNEATVGATQGYFEINASVLVDVYLWPTERTLEDVKVSI